MSPNSERCSGRSFCAGIRQVPGFVGLRVAGIGFAAIFPTLVSLTPLRIGRDRSTRMVGYQLGAASLGIAILAWVPGLFAEAQGRI